MADTYRNPNAGDYGSLRSQGRRTPWRRFLVDPFRHVARQTVVGLAKAGGQYELDQMHRYEQAAYLCEHRKCNEHFLGRARVGIHHRIPQWRGQHKGHRET